MRRGFYQACQEDTMRKTGGFMNKFGIELRFFVVILLLVLFVPLTLTGSEEKYEYRILKDPKPTMEETHYTELVKVGEIADEVGEDQFLFYPLDLASDISGNLYIYDRYQSTVIKLDKDLNFVTSIGRHGFGPGEIISKGRGPMVYIDVGVDNRLYVNDMRGFKVSVFELDGTFVRHYKYRLFKFAKPAADKGGNIITHDWKDRVLKFHNEKNETLFEFPYGDDDSKINYLYHKSIEPSKWKTLKKYRNDWFPLSFPEVLTLMLEDSTFLFYLSPSATLYVVQKGKLVRRIKVWPIQAMRHFKENIKSNLKQHRHRIYMMFYRMFRDGDKKDILYFHHGNVKEKGMNCLYKVNTKGELLDVLYVKLENNAPFVNFRVKQNGVFYARQDEKVVIYKEVSK
jgi:hypothetical protein